jgi:MFS family permease
VFAFASLACGAAPGPAVFIAARLVQGTGAEHFGRFDDVNVPRTSEILCAGLSSPAA